MREDAHKGLRPQNTGPSFRTATFRAGLQGTVAAVGTFEGSNVFT